ncbi:MAG: flagellar biosynthesis protein FlhB [bacterium]
MAENSGADRTEQATPKRRQDARKKGQVAQSKEVNSFFVLVAGMSLLLLSSGHISGVLTRNASYLFSQAHMFCPGNVFGLSDIASGNMLQMLKALAPMVAGILIVGLAANLLQIGFNFSTEAMSFQFSKLNPLTGMKKFFGKKAFFEISKNLVKIAILAFLAFITVKGQVHRIISAPLMSLDVITDMGKHIFLLLIFKLLVFVMVLAVIDWIFQKYQYEESLKMTRAEVKQERKDLDGDPQIKARIKHIQLEMARRRMLSAIPTADVVVTNPEHFAVALRYKPGEPAPRVVAKGCDSLAQTIKKIARQSRVPIIENKLVARALYRKAQLGDLIPESLYRAVAEILAYVYRLKRA